MSRVVVSYWTIQAIERLQQQKHDPAPFDGTLINCGLKH